MEIEINDSAIDSFLIEGVSRKIPLIDIFVLLIKQLKGIKKITISHDPINYNSDDCMCQIDFLNHEYYTKAKSTLKSPNLLTNLFNEKEKKIKIKDCQKFRNNLIDETVNKTTALMFENMQIDHTNILEFICHLKEYIKKNSSTNENNENNYKISKIRQYNNRILIIFDYTPNCIKKYIRKGENEYQDEIPYLNYKGKNIPIIPKMKPISNLGKYKERNVKISMHCLNDKDKEQLFKIFEKNKNEDNLIDNDISEENELIDKMAENAYNNIINREKNNKEEKIKKTIINRKREREKEKNNEREKDKDRQRDKERNRDREKSRERKRDREKERKKEKERDYGRRNQKEREEHSHERKMDNNYKYSLGDDNNNDMNIGKNNNTNINNNNLGGLNINEKDLNQVASLFSNANAMNIVKYLLENNMFNNINNSNNNINNNNIPKKDNNIMKNNFNDNFNGMYTQNNLNSMNNQQLLNIIQNQGNLMTKQTQQQRINNIYGNSMNNNFQNMMNLSPMMNMDNNMINANYFNNPRQFPFPMNDQFMNQFGYKRKDNNDNNK